MLRAGPPAARSRRKRCRALAAFPWGPAEAFAANRRAWTEPVAVRRVPLGPTPGDALAVRADEACPIVGGLARAVVRAPLPEELLVHLGEGRAAPAHLLPWRFRGAARSRRQ